MRLAYNNFRKLFFLVLWKKMEYKIHLSPQIVDTLYHRGQSARPLLPALQIICRKTGFWVSGLD